MPPHETPSKPAAKSAVSRYVIPLVALVVIVGALAWVAQYLPSWQKEKKVDLPLPVSKDLVAFKLVQAQWEKTIAEPAVKDGGSASDPSKDVETGSKGHYDFPFKNVLGQDIEIVLFFTTCDCTSVKVCVLPAVEWDRLVKVQEEKPGEDLPYATEPQWHDLPNDRATEKATTIPVKADERGMVRVEWSAKKAAGQGLRLKPAVKFQRAGDPSMNTTVPLFVPVRMSQPIQFNPARIVVPPLIAGKAVKKFEVWSSTRSKLDFSLDPMPADPHFVFAKQEYSKEKCAALERYLIANKLGSRVLSAYEVSLTVYESRDGRQLDQGAFYRQWPITLDGHVEPELFGPEIVGRVKGDIQIGGAEDQGKIRFKSFDAAVGGSKEVELSADAKVDLVTHIHTPSWIQVTLTGDKKKSVGQRVWTLEVTVPPNTTGARSFDEPDAVTLRIVGTPERFLRIPLEGHISGR